MGANWTASCFIPQHLVTALRVTAKFRLGDHTFLMGKGRAEIRRRHAEAAETTLGEARAAVSMTDVQRMGRIQRTGAWLSVLSYVINGTELGAQEWRDFLFLS